MFVSAAEIQRDAPVFTPVQSNFGGFGEPVWVNCVWVNCSGQISPRPTLSCGVHQLSLKEVVHTPV